MSQNKNSFTAIHIRAGNYDVSLPQMLEELCVQVETFDFHSLASFNPAKYSFPYLVMHCGNDEESCLDNAKKIIKRAELYSLPLIVLGFQVDEIMGVLESFFPVVSGARIPFKKSQLFESIEFVKLNYPSTANQDAVVERELAVDTDAEEEAVELDAARADLTFEIALELESLPKELFRHLSKLDLSNLTLGGREYSSKIDLNFLDLSGAIQEDGLTLSDLQAALESFPAWPRGHICRSYFITRKIASAMDIEHSHRKQLSQAAFFFASAITEQHNNLLRTNYYESNLSGVRVKIADAIARSSQLVSSKQLEPGVAETILQFAALVRGDSIDLTTNESLMASILMGAELLDRICFYAGMWNPRAAYQLMRKLKSGFLKELPAPVWSALVKFLSEAIASRQSIFVIPRDVRMNENLMQDLLAIRNTPVKPDQERIPVSELQPGMQLAQPLWTFDGKKLLSEKIVLDQDLVWRIWQLSAVRPLNSPVIVRDSRPKNSVRKTQLPDSVKPPARKNTAPGKGQTSDDDEDDLN